MDIENGMVLELETNKKRKIYAFCDQCGYEIYEDDEVTLISENDTGLICHSECFMDFINDNKETFIAKERM